MVAMAAGLTTGCKAAQQVQILANNNEVWQAPLGTNALYNGLGISQYTHPPDTLQLQVDAGSGPIGPSNPDRRTELVAFPFGPATVWTQVLQHCYKVFSSSLCIATPPSQERARAVGFIYQFPGRAEDFPVGKNFQYLNGNAPQAVKGVYIRRHGICEAHVPWNTALNTILDQVKDSNGQSCNHPVVGCLDYQVHYHHRVAESYLRPGTGLSAQGGFIAYADGEVDFDAPYVQNVQFEGNDYYDVSLSNGVPKFTVAGFGAYVTAGCSSFGFDCPSGTVSGDVTSTLDGKIPGELNSTIDACMSVPIPKASLGTTSGTAGTDTDISCTDATKCADSSTAQLLAQFAQTEARTRGDSVAHSQLFAAALADSRNWTCGPVTATCAALTNSTATDKSVCQLNLRAQDLIAMPDYLALVWQEGYLDAGPKPTAVEALYLALNGLTRNGLDESDKIKTLCKGTPNYVARNVLLPPIAHPFAYVSK